MTPAFWQAMLAAEMTPHKASIVLSGLRNSRLDPLVSLRTHPRLAPAEIQRAEQADMPGLERALAKGAFVLEGNSLSESVLQVTPAVFAFGDASILSRPKVSIVGTRAASTYGKAAAQKFAEYLAERGCLIVSGGALGIDAAAHKGAMAAGQPTAVVLGNGVDVVYPAVHRSLFDSILQQGGLLLSQFAVGAKPNRFKFLLRNRLIAGLADVVIVIEAPEQSGALSTAAAAVELNKQVCVVPANISSDSFRGSHALIRDGASLVDHPDQVLQAMGIEISQSVVRAAPELSEVQQQIYDALSDAPISPEKISEATGLDASEVLAELTMLEVEGRVMRDGVGYSRGL